MNPAPFDLRGQVAIVTGGATGIGLGIARALASAGAGLVLCGRRLDRCEEACAELSRLGGDAIPYQCDVSRERDVEIMVDAVIERCGRLDILVNSAGIAGSAKPVLEIDLAQWQETIAINLTGTFLCSKAAARHMVRQGHGKIINVASVGSFLPLPSSADYSASKGGVLMLTRAMALDLISHGINVNALCPGYVATALKESAIERLAPNVTRKIPAGRIGSPADIGGAALFLASPASDYMVGASIVIDGGVMLR